MKEVFKDNGIYPYHFMYDTGLVEELSDLIFRKSRRAGQRAGGLADWLDRVVEHIVRRPGTFLWEEMKLDASDAFAKDGAGTEALKMFFEALKNVPANRRKKIHLAGHSTGAVLFAQLLDTLKNYEIQFDTCSLLAPACTVDLYHKTYLRRLEKKHKLRIGQMAIYNLKDQLEQDDAVGSKLVYRKSLLYLVSNAFERVKERPLLGMEKFKGHLKTSENGPVIYYSNGVSGNKTRSKSHGGFDNDPHTMNHLLRTVIGRAPKRPFTQKDLV